jgi:hypothetical protein
VGAGHGRDEGEDVVCVAGNGLGRVVSGLSGILGKRGSFDRRDLSFEGERRGGVLGCCSWRKVFVSTGGC